MASARKASVKLGGIAVSAKGSTAWRFQTGVQPYIGIFSVHKSVWTEELEGRVGEFLDLEVIDARDASITVRDLTILHTVPSDGPKRISFAVADRRWKWSYKLVVRDYNMPRKTGDRTLLGDVPVETQQAVDKFDYLPYSLSGGDTKWTPRTALQDLGDQIEPNDLGAGGIGNTAFRIESLPIEVQESGTSDGQFSLQGIMLRDQADVALARLLSYIPGAAVYVDSEGTARVFDAADLDRVEGHFNQLPPTTWDADSASFIDRSKIRPANILVHYQREVELLLDFQDGYIGGRTVPANFRDTPYIDNVIMTTDPLTSITEYDPEVDATVTRDVAAGTWVQVDKWLEAMNLIKPEGSLRWTWDQVKRHWLHGDLDGVWGGKKTSGGSVDLDEQGNVSMRIQSFKQHFRQTFRINRRYMERVRSVSAIRVAILDPVTGARAPAAVWGQACIVPSAKGKMIAGRKDPENAFVYRNVDYLPRENEDVKDRAAGPARVSILDRDLGVFSVSYIASPYGTVDSFVPCHLVGEADATKPVEPTRNLARQDDDPMGPGMKLEGGTNGIYLRDSLHYKVMLTIVPSAPNNKGQYHVEKVSADDIADVFASEFRIQSGEGPDLEVFIPPGELTARWAWDIDEEAPRTMALLLGLADNDPTTAGIRDNPDTENDESQELDGFVFVNKRRDILGHSKAVAAEMIAAFADNLQGKVATILPDGGVRLRGNMTGATIQVAAAPSSKVNVVHEFPGQQKQISRLAMMPEATRQTVLGIIYPKPEL